MTKKPEKTKSKSASKPKKAKTEKTTKKTTSRRLKKAEKELAKSVVSMGAYQVIKRFPSPDCLTAILPLEEEGVKIGTEDIRLINGYFRNKIQGIQKYYYDAMGSKGYLTLCLADEFYILPAHNKEKADHVIEVVRHEFAELEKQLRYYLRTGKVPKEIKENPRAIVDEDYIEIVKAVLNEKRKTNPNVPTWDDIVNRANLVERISVRFIPFNLNYDVILASMDERQRAAMEKQVEREQAAMGAVVMEAFEKKCHEFENKFAEDLVFKDTARRLEKLEETFHELESLAIVPQAAERVKALKTAMFDNPTEFLKREDVRSRPSVRAAALSRKMADERREKRKDERRRAREAEKAKEKKDDTKETPKEKPKRSGRAAKVAAKLDAKK